MMRTVLWAATSCLACIGIPIGSASAAPKITVEKPIHNFGIMLSSDTVRHSYVLSNAGDEPLVIGEVRASCGCTVPKIKERTVAPGKSVGLDVELSLSGIRGATNKSLVVETNDPSVPLFKLNLIGEVKPVAMPATLPSPEKGSVGRPSPTIEAVGGEHPHPVDAIVKGDLTVMPGSIRASRTTLDTSPVIFSITSERKSPFKVLTVKLPVPGATHEVRPFEGGYRVWCYGLIAVAEKGSAIEVTTDAKDARFIKIPVTHAVEGFESK